jgi:hypothetical protein
MVLPALAESTTTGKRFLKERNTGKPIQGEDM